MLSPDWYAIGCGMGMKLSTLQKVRAEGMEDREKVLSIIKELVSYGHYETGHLWQVVQFVDHPEMLSHFPAHLRCLPSAPLCAANPRATANLCFLAIARNLIDKAHEFGKSMSLESRIIDVMMRDYKDHSYKPLIQMIRQSMCNISGNRKFHLQRISKAAIKLLPDLKIILENVMMFANDFAGSEGKAGATPDWLQSLASDASYEQLLERAIAGMIDAPDEYLCPITGCLIAEPAYLESDGVRRAYERSALTRWVERQFTNPMTRAPVKLDDIKPYPKRAQDIREWLEQSAS